LTVASVAIATGSVPTDNGPLFPSVNISSVSLLFFSLKMLAIHGKSTPVAIESAE
jgi:hypothetical protein